MQKRILFQKLEQTGSVNDNHIGNVGQPRFSVTDSIAEIVQQVIQQWSCTSVLYVPSLLQPKEEYSPSHAPYPLCVPVKNSRLSNSSVQMPLMHTIFS